MPEPTTMALIASGIVSGIGSFLGGKSQADALEDSLKQQMKIARMEQQFQQAQLGEQKAGREQLFDFMNLLRADQAPFRELAGEAGELIREDITREPGTGQLFTQGLERGSAALAGELSKFGLLDSSIGERGFQDLTSSLLGRDIQSIRNQRMGLLGLRGAGNEAGSLAPSALLPPGIQPLAGTQAMSNVSNLTAQLGATKGGIFSAISQLPYQALLTQQLFSE